MRFLLAIILVCTVVGIANAVDQPFSNVAPSKELYVGDGASDGREGGESWGDALVITTLPFSDTGATCDNLNDITLPCAGSNAPDVVYSYTPTANGAINVALCGSGYDTALGIYDAGQVNLFCNDDFCSLQSEIDHIAVTAGQTYYIVVDGYSTNCGSYIINVVRDEPCEVICPQGAWNENEPDCGTDYYDTTNGGCNSTGWTDMCPQDGTHAVMCGKSGTYLYYGASYRDTDWIRIYGNGETATATCEAEFPLQLIFIYGLDCSNPTYDLTTSGPCIPASLSHYLNLGQEAWIWVGPSAYAGYPCGMDWTLTMDGIYCVPTPAEKSTWGSIKNLYK